MVWSPVATQRLSQVRPVDRHGRPDDVDLLEDDDFLELFGSRIDTDAPRSPGALSSSPSCAATEPVDDSASKRPPCSPCVASPLKEQEEKRPKRVTKPTSKILSQISRVIVAAAAAEAKANKVDAVKKRNEHRPARVYPPPVPRQILSSDALSARPPPPPARPAPAAAYRVLFPAGTESAAVDAFEKELPARLPAHIAPRAAPVAPPRAPAVQRPAAQPHALPPPVQAAPPCPPLYKSPHDVNPFVLQHWHDEMTKRDAGTTTMYVGGKGGITCMTGVNNFDNLIDKLLAGDLLVPEECVSTADFITGGMRLARAGTHSACAPIDWFCRLGHLRRSSTLAFYYETVRMTYGTAVDTFYAESSLKKHVDSIMAYTRHFERQDSSEATMRFYDGNYVWTTSNYYRTLQNARKKYNSDALNRPDNLTLDDGITKGGAHAFEIAPAQSQTFRIFLDNLIRRFEENDFDFIDDEDCDWLRIIAAGSTTGYSQFLCVIRSRFMLDVATNGLGRGHESFEKMSDFDFHWVYDNDHDCVASWVLENYRKKHTSTGQSTGTVHRAPFMILDTGVNEGLRKRYDILMSGRKTGQPIGDGGNGYPAIGSRMLLKPIANCSPTSLVKWSEQPIGTNKTNIIGPFISWLQKEKLFPDTAYGAKFTMGGFRSGGSCDFDRHCVPPWMRSVFQGHTAQKALQFGRDGHGDGQLKAYSRSLGCSVMDCVKMAMFLSMPVTSDRAWCNIVVDPAFITLVRNNLPTYIKQSSVDAELMHVDLAAKMVPTAANAALNPVLANFRSAPDAYKVKFKQPPRPAAPALPQQLVPQPCVDFLPPNTCALTNVPNEELLKFIEKVIAQRPAPAQTIHIHKGANVTFNAT
mmetsp:Transcript_6546/g.23222  ORF Transcript_6546/g.23222 Transcript_6546/m.23222 type:complete len:865 (+) Transcript_6546:297-2891(+)